MRSKRSRLAGHPVVETHAHCYYQVAFLYRLVCVVRAVHARHAERKLVCSGKTSKPHKGHRNRYLGILGKVRDLLVSAGYNNAATGYDHRPRGLGNHARRLGYHELVALVRRLVAPYVHLGPDEIGLPRRHVLWQVNEHRAGPSRSGDMKSLFHRRRKVVNVLHEEVVFCAWSRNSNYVCFLKGVVSYQQGGHLSGHHHQGHGVHRGRRDASNCIRRARARSDEHHAGLSACSCIAVGSVHGPLFVPREYELQVFFVIEVVEDVKHNAARITEDVLHALALQGFDYYLSTSDFH